MRRGPGPVRWHVIVRDALPAELDQIADLRVSAYRADGFLPEQSTYEPALRALGQGGQDDLLVAVEPGRLLGTVMLQIWPAAGEVVRGPGEAEIRALAVDPAARGRGIGHALLTAITDRARHRGVGHLVLLTQTQMAVAQRLYLASGFIRLPERDFSPNESVRLLAYGRTLR